MSGVAGQDIIHIEDLRIFVKLDNGDGGVPVNKWIWNIFPRSVALLNEY